MAIDRVQPLKLEAPDTGGDQVDEFPTAVNVNEDHIECAGIVLDDADHRDETTRIWRVGDNLTFTDSSNPTPHTLTDLLAGSGGMTEESHRLLDQLTHEIDESSFDEITRVSGKVTNITVWDGPSKLKKIREAVISRTGGKVSQIVTTQYDAAGLVKETLTEVIARTGGKVVSITRTRS